MTTDQPLAAGGEPTATPDPAFAALPRLAHLRDALVAAVQTTPPRRPTRWGEPPVFFFDPARQAQLEAAHRSPAGPEQFAELSAAITAELPALFASVEVRRAARTVAGLREAAAALAPQLPAAKDLADLLDVPDDETVLVIDPATRTGFRLFVQGIADADQFQLLLVDAIAAEGLLSGPPLPARFRTACRDADPVIPAGVPMVAESRFQFLRPAALRTDGSVPGGFCGSEHWVWGHQPLSSAPRIDGERVLLLCEPAFRRTWEVERRFPSMPAELRLLQVLGPFQVAERLGRIVGQPVPVRVPEPEQTRPAKAA
jgi:hypothetical protein